MSLPFFVFCFENSSSISYMVDLGVINYHSICLTVKDDFLFEGQLWHILASQLAILSFSSLSPSLTQFFAGLEGVVEESLDLLMGILSCVTFYFSLLSLLL